MNPLITEAELTKLIYAWEDLRARQPRTYPPGVLAHELVKLVETRRELDENKKTKHG